MPESGRGVAKPDYLKERRDVEIGLLSEWVPQLDTKTTKWLLTVVTKADLWWPDEGGKIKAFYETGAYASKLDEFKTKNVVLPYCSIVKPFFDYRTGGRFGDEARAKLRSHLFATLVDQTRAES